MNLSDLVHRTAGDNNKVLNNANNNNSATTPSDIFQSSSPSHVFNTLTRQDPSSFLFSMPNLSQTDWINESLFFNNTNSNTATTDTIDSPNSFLAQDLSFTAAFLNSNNLIQPYNNNISNVSSPSNNNFIHTDHSPSSTTSLTLSNITTPLITNKNNIHANSFNIKPSNPPPPQQHVEQQPTKKIPKITITGENVSANNIEDGYIQFVLNHDANYIGDGIESLMYARRKFASVPKTGDLSYTTWDIYELVLKLHKREIKNWSQLVGQLGLVDMAGRPQFAQRVKRWMHRYKIDCYFDYLLGNKFYFNAPSEKYSGCLMMGNYKKRRGHEMSTEEDEEEEEESRIPILLAGSRKRMRDHSQNSLQMIENAKQYLKTSAVDSDTDTDDEDDNSSMIKVDQEELEQEEEEDDTVIPPPIDEDEEDELASTSSTPGSPVTKIISSCPQHEETIKELRNEITLLKQQLSTRIEQQSAMSIQLDKLLKLKEKTEKWRKQLIEDLARGPSVFESEEEVEDDESD